MVYKRYPRGYRLLECYGKGVELRLQHWQNVMTAHEKGKLLVDGFVWAPYELVAGIGDFVPFGADVYAANVASEPDFNRAALGAAEAKGFARDTCGYFRNDVGTMFLNRYLFGGEYPKLDFIFTCHDCEARGRWYRTKAEHQGVPIFILDFPLGREGVRLENKIDYVANQLYDGIEFMEKATGRTYDDERFFAALHNSLRSQEIWSEIALLKRAIPSPLNVRTQASLISIPLLRRHEPEAVAFLEELRDEIQYRVDTGLGCLDDETKRVMTDQMPPWFALNVTKHTELAYGCVWVSMLIYDLLIGNYEVDEQGQLKVKYFSHMPIRSREDAIGVLAENLAECGVCIDLGSVQDKAEWALRFARHWRVDGVVLHYNRSCPGGSTGLREVEWNLKKAGLPVVAYEAAGQDIRDANEPEIRDNLERFMEMLGLKPREGA